MTYNNENVVEKRERRLRRLATAKGLKVAKSRTRPERYATDDLGGWQVRRSDTGCEVAGLYWELDLDAAEQFVEAYRKGDLIDAYTWIVWQKALAATEWEGTVTLYGRTFKWERAHHNDFALEELSNPVSDVMSVYVGLADQAKPV